MAGIDRMTCAAGTSSGCPPNGLLIGYPGTPVILGVGMAVDIVARTKGCSRSLRNRGKRTVIFSVHGTSRAVEGDLNCAVHMPADISDTQSRIYSSGVTFDTVNLIIRVHVFIVAA